MTTTPATQALFPVTPEDTKRADDWATMIGRMGGVFLDQSQRRGLASQFAAHRQAHSLPGDVESIARALFVFQHQGDIDDPGQVWDAPDKGLHPIYWTQKMEHNHPHYRAMARAALAALTPSALSGDAGEG